MNNLITVLIATYNPSIEKLLNTIRSIIFQEGLSIEIIITDDGSAIFPKKEVDELFYKYEFDKYRVVLNDENAGTVKNLLSGIEISSGEYIKLISPGDYFYSKYALRELYNVACSKNSDIVFGDVVYYDEFSSEMKAIKHLACPQNVYPYLKDNMKSAIYNYLIINDTIHGVSTLCKKKVLENYLLKASGRVLYAEDCLYRIMINEGLKFSYCPHNVVLYGYGGGISTGKENNWSKIIHNDLKETDKYITNNIGKIDKKIFVLAVKYRESKNIDIFLRLVLKSPIFAIFKIRNKLLKRYTDTIIDYNFFNRISMDS